MFPSIMSSKKRKIDYAHLPKTEAKKFLVEKIRQKRKQEDDSVPLWKRRKVKAIPPEMKISPSPIPSRAPKKTKSGRSVRQKTKSKYSGVSYVAERGGKWRAVLMYKRTAHELGYFDFESSAAAAVDKKYVQLAGHFADENRLNFKRKLGEYRRQIRLVEKKRKDRIEKERIKKQQDLKRRKEKEAKRRIEAQLVKSKYKGVRKNKHNWEAFLQFRGAVYRSFHRSELEAAAARDKMVVENCGRYFPDAKKLAQELNFPERLVSPHPMIPAAPYQPVRNPSPLEKVKKNPLKKKALGNPLKRAMQKPVNPLKKALNPAPQRRQEKLPVSPAFQPAVVPNIVPKREPIVPTFNFGTVGIPKPTFS